MAQGIQVFDEQGNITLDLNKKFPRIIGNLILNGNGNITNVSLGYPNNKLWYFIVSNVSPSSNIDAVPFIRINETSTIISYGNMVGTQIRYGIY